MLCRPHLPDPGLQRPQLLGVFVAGLVVGSNGSGDGRERKACGGRISISGGFGQLTGGGSVVMGVESNWARAVVGYLEARPDGKFTTWQTRC